MSNFINPFRFNAATMEWRVGLNIQQYTSDDADQKPTDRWNRLYVNGFVYPLTLPYTVMTDGFDFDGIARGIGFKATGDVNNDWGVRSGYVLGVDEHHFGDNDIPDNAMGKCWGKNSANKFEGTFTGLDPKKGYTIKFFCNISSFDTYSSDMTVWATGAQGEVISNTIPTMYLNLTDVVDTGMMFANNAGEIDISLGAFTTDGLTIYQWNCFIIEQHDVPVPTQTIGLSFYTYATEIINDTNHVGLTDIWNNSLTSDAAAAVPVILGAVDLLNFDGQPTGISVSSITETKIGGADGYAWLDDRMIFTNPDVPDDVHRRGVGWTVYQGAPHTEALAHFLIEGLDPLKTYNIYMMASWSSYTIGQGLNFEAVGDNTVTSNTIDGYNNRVERCEGLAIIPTGTGEIALTANGQTIPPEKSEWFFSINGFVIEEITASTPVVISPEAQDVLDRYSALTKIEHDAIVALINPFSASQGNNTWQYARQIWSLTLNATDRLTPMKTGDDAINNGCTFGINGATGDGISQDIDLKWNPVDDAPGWDADNNFIGFYNKEHNFVTNFDVYLGCSSGGDNMIDILADAGAITHSQWGSFTATYSQALADDTNYIFSINQVSGNQGYLWEDGVIVETDTAALSGGLPTDDLSLFSRNTLGTRDHWTPATCPLVIVGEDGFDFVEWNTQVKIYLATLGMTIP